MKEYPEHPITKETRARNTLYRFDTRRKICEYIYEQTGCLTCKGGKSFCSRDGDKWACLPYNDIAQHLNHIGWPTSRGNIGVWETKTVRDQITWGLRKLTEQEKQQRIDELNDQRDSEVVWETHEITDGTQEMLEVIEDKFGTTCIPVNSDIDLFLVGLKKIISTYHDQGMDVNIFHMPRGKQD